MHASEVRPFSAIAATSVQMICICRAGDRFVLIPDISFSLSDFEMMAVNVGR
jgi:hypothetical protein